MQKRTRSKLINLLYLVVCGAVCSISLNLFWVDLNSTSSRSDLTKIADITYKNNVVQRKYADRVVWERLQQNSPLYDADTIRTSLAAQATITLSGGASIEVDELTMLQINKSKDGVIDISVGGGNITVDTTKVDDSKQKAGALLSLSMEDGSKVNLEKGSRITAEKDEQTGKNNFQIEAGNASVKNKDGKIEKVDAGQSVQIEKDGSISHKAINVLSISSDLKLYKYEDEKTKSVPLEWTVSSEYKDKDVIVETSYDKNFEKIEKSYKTTGSGSVDVENSEGKLYWRVYSPEAQKDAVHGKITVQEFSELKLISPVNNSSIITTDKKNGISFSWNGDKLADSYRIEIFNSPKAEKPLVSEIVRETGFVYDGLPEGTYFWRVIPHYSVNNTGYGKASKINRLEVRRNTLSEKINLTGPAENAKVYMTDGITPISFAWKSDIKYDEYRLVIATDKNLKGKVYGAVTRGNRITNKFDSQKLPAGTYYWHIEGKNLSDETKTVSEVYAFEVIKAQKEENKLLYPPENYKVQNTALSKMNFLFKVGADYKKENYLAVIQFSSKSDFSTVAFEKRLSADSVEVKGSELKLSEGNWWWRIGVKEKSSQGYSGFTDARKLVVLAELDAPVFISPSSKNTNVLWGVNSINVKWKAVPGADYYYVKVFDESGTVIPQSKKTTRRTDFTVNLETEGKVPPFEKKESSKFYVQVQSYGEETENSSLMAGKTDRLDFTVRPPVSASLVSPVADEKISGLEALRSPVILRWKKGDAMSESSLILSKRSGDGSWQTVKTIKNPDEKISVARLTSGSYKWKIEGASKSGYQLSSTESTFTVGTVPPLAKPVLLSPANSFVIDSEYLKKNRNIVFDWNPVNGATDYSFVLYQRNDDGKLKRIYEAKVSESSIKFNKLKILDIGTFEWRVIAYAHAKDGYEEQKSTVAAGRFKIQFDLPEKIETVDSGIQYGE